MALFNYSAKEITLKVVYYGPGFSGKTTSLQYLHTVLPTDTKGKLISMATEGDRTIFFDFLPIEIGKIKDFNIRFQMYTVPGQVRYNATRRLVLKGSDAIIFVADSQIEMNEQNIESLNNMNENLASNNIPLDIPKVLQYNKRDIDNIMSIEELNETLNKEGYPFFESVAAEGTGVNEAFERITKDVLAYIKTKHNVDIEPPEAPIIPEGAQPSKAASGERISLKESTAAPEVKTPEAAPVTEDEPVIEIDEAPAPPSEPEPVQKPVMRDPFTAERSVEEEPSTQPADRPVSPAPTEDKEPGRPAAAKPSIDPADRPAAPAPAAVLDVSGVVSAINSLKEAVSKGSAGSAPPVAPDLSEITSAINGLKDAISEISKGLRGIQINQTKSIEELNEIKQIFSKGKDKKGISGIFKK